MRPGYFTPQRKDEFSEEEWELLLALYMAQRRQGNLKQLMVLTYDKDNYIDRMV